MKDLKMVRYNHPGNLNVWFFQYEKDPLPPWAIGVEPYLNEYQGFETFKEKAIIRLIREGRGEEAIKVLEEGE